MTLVAPKVALILPLSAGEQENTMLFAKNVGGVDGITRVIAGCAMAASGWYLGLPQMWTIGLAIMGAMTAMTGLIHRCSVYKLLGISTRRDA